MKKSNSITLWQFIASKLGIHIAVAIICIVIANMLLNYFWMPIYMTYHISPSPNVSFFKIDLEQYSSMSKEYLEENNASLVVLNEELTVIHTINTDKPLGYQYSDDELSNLLLQKQENYVLRAEKIYHPQNGANTVLLKLDTNFLEILKQSSNTYGQLIVLLDSLILLFVCFSFIRSIYKPLKNNLEIIRNTLQKTPYDTSLVDVEQLSLLELQLLLKTYNTMLTEMNQIKKEKETLEAKSHRLIANLSHDLKSPMTGLRGYTELLEQDNLSAKEQKEYLSHIHSNVTTLNSMVELLGEQVKYQYDDYQLNLERNDMNSFLREICANYYTIFEMKGFQVDIQIEEESHYIDFDSTHMRRVYSNLLDNILSHNINPTNVQIYSGSIDNCYMVKIKDNGIGIHFEHQNKIFEPFYQCDESRTHHSGLGLFVVKQILEKHNASIVLEDEPTYKTVFTIKFNN